MNLPPRLLAATLSVVLLAGCAAYSPAELTSFSRARVAYPTLVKLEKAEPLEPSDLIELTRRGIPPETIVRHIEKYGVDSLISRTDVVALRKAGVRPTVIDAAIRASDRFAAHHSGGPEVDVGLEDDYGWSFGPAWWF